ncbi:MAG TPA: mycofactocin system FadH/OYE family oxidoreductase 1 [Mycobacteriales bacterium]|nr:mycofactocin system FadH/OYE family oxidoreductase 1 [Mycobacteriales bacterium]
MRLLAPVDVGSRRARNRLMFGPHETNLGLGRAFSAAHQAYYARRALGGCGIVVTETASVHDSDWPYERAPAAAEAGAGWRRIAGSLHDHDTLCLASLGHAGLQGSSAYHQQALWAPSRFPDPVTREVPMVMEGIEIAALVDGFARSAGIAVQAGCDGVELEAGQHSLLRQFLSGLTNTRDDDYGADRTRLVREVIGAVRRELGPLPVLGLRLSCDEQAPWAGITPEDAGPLAAALAGGVDYVVAVRAGPFDAAGTRPDSHTEPGFALPLAIALRAALPLEIRVVAQGSLIDAELAEQACEHADLVEMTRAQIADPDLAVTLARGATPRPCVLCNQTCRVRDARNPIVTCIGEPRSGHELTDPEPARDPNGQAQQVTVVGAGPAGLEAARVAALRGHQVTVYDRTSRAGGAVREAARGAGRGSLARLTDWLAAECGRLGVQWELGTEVERLPDSGPVLLATGSVPREPPWLAQCTLPVFGAREVLAGVTLPDGPVLIDDPVGGPVGVSVAERLAAEGRSVTLLTPDTVVGSQLARTGDLAPANARLARAGVTSLKRCLLRGADPAGAIVEDRYTGERQVLSAGCIIDAGHLLPHAPLAEGHDEDPRVVVIGDAVAPRTIAEAVLEGRRAGLAVGAR